ncbi:hypothetical protein ES707_12085 [subsurface metagenome]
MGLGDIGHQVGFKVPRVVDVFKVGFRFIGAGDKIAPGGYGVIGDNLEALYTDGRGGAGNDTGLDNLVLGGETEVGTAQCVLELYLVYLNVPPDDDEDQPAVGDIEHRFEGMAWGYFKETGHLFNRAGARRGYFLPGQRLTLLYLALDALGFLHVGGVFTFFAVDNLVFTVLGDDHELVGVLAADGAAVGFNLQAGQAAAGIDILIRLEHLFIAFIQPLFISVKAVEVFHGEFAYPYQAAPGAGLIAELGLDLIQHQG